MTETQWTVTEWAVNTFGPEPIGSTATVRRIIEEVVELAYAVGMSGMEIERAAEDAVNRALRQLREESGDLTPDGLIRWNGHHPRPDEVGKEFGDVLVTVESAAGRRGIDIGRERDERMANNRARTWERHGDGTGHHIKE